jgi:hypothetical protein
MGPTTGLLGGHIVGRADDGAGARQVRLVPEASSQAEVGDLGTTVGRQEDIGGPQVAVDDTLEVCGVDGAGEGVDRPNDSRDVLRASVHLLLQAAAVDEFEGQVREAAGLTDVVNLNDIGVIEAGDGLGFLLEPRQDTGASVGAGQNHLEPDQATQVGLAGLINDAHAAAD